MSAPVPAAAGSRLGPPVVCGGTASDWWAAYRALREWATRDLDPAYAAILWPVDALPIYRPTPTTPHPA